MQPGKKDRLITNYTHISASHHHMQERTNIELFPLVKEAMICSYVVLKRILVSRGKGSSPLAVPFPFPFLPFTLPAHQ
jgi:hypothetical protein